VACCRCDGGGELNVLDDWDGSPCIKLGDWSVVQRLGGASRQLSVPTERVWRWQLFDRGDSMVPSTPRAGRPRCRASTSLIGALYLPTYFPSPPHCVLADCPSRCLP
jgi:hypothetical protein